MPAHDWTRVDANTFYDFHGCWITHLKENLNGGMLPHGYYAISEQHLSRRQGDVLALHDSDPDRLAKLPIPSEGVVAAAVAPPSVRHTLVADRTPKRRRRHLAIRHTSGRRIIALIEIISPGNKDSAANVATFVEKVTTVLQSGIHVLVLDLLPPGRHDRFGMHGAVWDGLGQKGSDPPEEKPLRFASYAAGPPVRAYLEELAAGDALPEMPLFLTSELYVKVPLEMSYAAAFRGMAEVCRNALEGPTEG